MPSGPKKRRSEKRKKEKGAIQNATDATSCQDNTTSIIGSIVLKKNSNPVLDSNTVNLPMPINCPAKEIIVTEDLVAVDVKVGSKEHASAVDLPETVGGSEEIVYGEGKLHAVVELVLREKEYISLSLADDNNARTHSFLFHFPETVDDLDNDMVHSNVVAPYNAEMVSMETEVEVHPSSDGNIYEPSTDGLTIIADGDHIVSENEPKEFDIESSNLENANGRILGASSSQLNLGAEVPEEYFYQMSGVLRDETSTGTQVTQHVYASPAECPLSQGVGSKLDVEVTKGKEKSGDNIITIINIECMENVKKRVEAGLKVVHQVGVLLQNLLDDLNALTQ